MLLVVREVYNLEALFLLVCRASYKEVECFWCVVDDLRRGSMVLFVSEV